METKIIEKERKEEWEAYIRRSEKAIAWQSYEWSDVLARHYKFDFFPIAVYDRGNIVGVLPIYHVKTLMGGTSLISVPHAVAGGIVADDPAAATMLFERAVDISRSHGSCRIVLKQYKHRIDGDLLTDDNYYNRELSLSRDVDAVRAQFSRKNQDAISDTERFPVSLESHYDKLSEFHGLLLGHLHARGIPGVGKKWIRDLLHFRMYSIAMLMVAGKPVAGTLVKEFKKTVSFPFTCLSISAGKGNPGFAYRLYWELIKSYSLKGFDIFHSGRIPNNDATDEYRLGWGGAKYPYFYQYYPNRNIRTEYETKRGRKREILEKCWRHLPTSVAGAIGPLVVSQFP